MNLQGIVFGMTRNDNGEVTGLQYALQDVAIADEIDIEAIEIIEHEANTGRVGHTILIHTNGCELVGEVRMTKALSSEHSELLAYAANGGLVGIRFPKHRSVEAQLRSEPVIMEEHRAVATVYTGHLDHILRAASL